MRLGRLLGKRQKDRCPVCGASLTGDDPFCTACGARLVDKAGPANDSLVPSGKPAGQCVVCGSPLLEDSAFCVVCGAKVEAARTPAAPEPPKDVPSPPFDIPGPIGMDPVAGAASVETVPTTGGTVRVEDSDGAIGGPAASNEGGTRYCMRCGAALRPNVPFCECCGAPVEDAKAPAEPAPRQPQPLPHKTVMVDAARPMAADDPLAPPRPASPAPSAQPTYESVSRAPIVDESGEVIDDDPLMLTELVCITPDEARLGCRKTLTTESGDVAEIKVPAGAHAGTKVDIAGLGLVDKRTGERGVLRVSFFIER